MGNIIIRCTSEQWSTIYTALRMEYEQNKDRPEARRLLSEAIKAVSNREVVG